MAQHKNGGGLGIFQILLQGIHIADILRLLYDDHLMFCHHGIAPCHICHSGSRYVRTKENGLVEITLLGGKHMLGNIIAYLVNIICLFAHQVVNGSIFLLFQGLHHRLKGLLFRFCHY